MAEIEAYARIEPIAWDVAVSEPPKKAKPPTVSDTEARQNLDAVASLLGARRTRTRRKSKKGK